MYTVHVHVLVCAFYGSFFFWFTNSYMSDDFSFQFRNVSSTTVKPYNYERIDEVTKQCGFLLSSATELNREENKMYSIKRDLTFRNGDWKQDIGKSPLLPFHDKDKNPQKEGLLKMASFWVTNVDRSRATRTRTNKFVRVGGTLRMDITPEDSYPNMMWRPNEYDLKFQIWPNHTQLVILFQGIYMETQNERVMCFLGDTVLPSRDSDTKDPWGWVGSYENQPPLLQDDQIILTLRYPKNFTLTSRVIRGEMKSLNPETNLKFFDKVHILSQLSRSRRYQFSSIVSKPCDPYPYNVTNDVYKETGFCEILERINNERAFMVLPNRKYNITDDDYTKPGPFKTVGDFQNLKIYMQNVICEETTVARNSTSAKVAAVFRAVVNHRPDNQYATLSRSGITNTTVFAEGVWNSTTGQLCMVGCVGITDTERSICNNTRIRLYIPMTFSIMQHGIIVGTFYSLEKRNTSLFYYHPLSFQKLVEPTQLWNYIGTSIPRYTYTKIETASKFLAKNEGFSFGSKVKKSVLRFPKLENEDELFNSLSYLSEDLTLHTSATENGVSTTNVELEIISIGSLFGRFWSNRNSSTSDLLLDSPYQTKPEYTEKELLLNISAQILLNEKTYRNVSVIFLEGLYDQHIGKAYFVGCRYVKSSWKVLSEIKNVEDGLDCLIEVIVAYPSTTAQWLINPTAMISIGSQRTEDDPLYFRPIKLRTFPITYRQQLEDIVSRKSIEGFLQILTLSFAITCISIQLLRIKRDQNSVPFISLVMLGIQAVGYSLPLMTSAEAFFNKKKKPYETSSSSSYDLQKSQWLYVIDHAVKLLVMASFLLTLRLFQKVRKSRLRLVSPESPHRVIPTDKLVLLTTTIVHVIGYTVTVLIVHSTNRDRDREIFGSHKLNGWEIELEEYIGVVQDLFLVPQVIGNLIWKLDCKPLQKLYYIGLTIVRLVPHVYDRVTAPVLPIYFGENFELVNPNFDFYSRFGDVAIPVVALLLAVLVYVQQKWSYEKIVGFLTFGKVKVYERLPSKSLSVEAELTSRVNQSQEGKNDDGEE